MPPTQAPRATSPHHHYLFPLSLAFLATLALPPSDAFGANRKTKPPTALGSFTDHLTSFDSTRWTKADGWKNGAPFDNAWAADHITFSNSAMRILRDNQLLPGEPYTSGNYSPPCYLYRGTTTGHELPLTKFPQSRR